MFVPALPGDNPYLPHEYTKTLESAFGHRPELLQAYLYGSWDSLDGATQVIKSEWIQATKKRKVTPNSVKHYLVCDTARFGDDETVIGRFQDTNLVEKIVLGHTKSTEISARLALLLSSELVAMVPEMHQLTTMTSIVCITRPWSNYIGPSVLVRSSLSPTCPPSTSQTEEV